MFSEAEEKFENHCYKRFYKRHLRLWCKVVTKKKGTFYGLAFKMKMHKHTRAFLHKLNTFSIFGLKNDALFLDFLLLGLPGSFCLVDT